MFHHQARMLRPLGRAALLVCLAVAVSGCVQKRLPVLGLRVPFPRNPLAESPPSTQSNYSALSWTEAFEALHGRLVREYPFTEWKRVSWDSLYDRFALRIADAEARDDARAYYRALREYVHSVPDGYLGLSMDEARRMEAVGGGFGFSVVPLDDARLIVYRVARNSGAAAAGITWGTQIHEWNGKPAREALDEVPAIWVENPSPTYVGRMLDRCMLLTRAPVGGEARITFRKPGDDRLLTTTLTAQNDQYLGMGDVVSYGRSFSELESPFETRILPGNIGYVNILSQSSTLTTPFPDRAYRKAIEKFVRDGVAGLVLDLRGNSGGDPRLAAAFAGHFMRERRVIGDMVAFDPRKGGFSLQEDGRIEAAPIQPHIGAPVVVLVHRSTRDTGQVIAAALQGQPQVTVMGVLGTEGSLAKVGGEARMPGGHVVHFPIGRVVDPQGGVVISTDAGLDGGVVPDVVIPATLELLDAQFNRGRDPVLDAALALLRGKASGG